LKEIKMAQIYFHYSGAEGMQIDRHGSDTDDPLQACEDALRTVQMLIATATLEDWRHWVLHISDEEGARLFDIPFSTLLGKPH